ncbi:MAG: YicC family protein [Bryobacterales bacterium]|nr:YicC family protein [Acidobacteriota bacterium]MCB9385126.1 YicC family protein [Bryobacterales bacterium]
MTGFARVATDGEPALEATVRSVNNRFLDVKIRTPSDFDALDPQIRALVAAHVKRGSVQIHVNLRAQRTTTLRLNRALAEAYLDAYGELAQARGVTAAPDLTSVLRIPGVLEEASAERTEEQQEALNALLLETLEAAMTKLNEERAREGAGIVADVRARGETIAAEAAAVAEPAANLAPAFQQRVATRLEALLGAAPIDQQRVLQEAAVLADRCDVSEELQRLAAHARRLFELLDGGGEVGKQLDFLAQEMNREANTLLSKTTPLGEAGLPLTDAGLRLKAEIEKIREQAQNLE